VLTLAPLAFEAERHLMRVEALVEAVPSVPELLNK
jgi:hypothetical protein